MSMKNTIRAYVSWWYNKWYLNMLKPRNIFHSLLIAIMGFMIITIVLSFTLKR